MKLPDRSRHWVKEIEKAFSKAVLKADKEKVEDAYLYRYVPELVARARGLSKPEIIEIIKEDVEARVQQNWKLEEDAKLHYKFYFVYSYIHSHVATGFLSEKEADRIMDEMNQSLDLFDDCGGCGGVH